MCTVRWQQWSVILHFYIPNGPFNEPADASFCWLQVEKEKLCSGKVCTIQDHKKAGLS